MYDYCSLRTDSCGWLGGDVKLYRLHFFVGTLGQHQLKAHWLYSLVCKTNLANVKLALGPRALKSANLEPQRFDSQFELKSTLNESSSRD